MVKSVENTRTDDGTSEFESTTISSLKLERAGEFYGESPWFLGVGSWTPELSQDESVPPLTYVEAVSLAYFIEEAADELHVLKYVIGAPVLDPLATIYSSLKERCSRRLTPVRVFPEAEVRPTMTSAIKLQRERELIEVIFNRTSKSLVEELNYFPLVMAMGELHREVHEDENLIQELKENIINLRELKIKVEEKKKLDDLEEKERDELMYQLQDEMDDVRLKCHVEQTFVRKWENVRTAQNKWKLRLTENFYKDNMLKFLTKIRLEKRVTHDLQLYLKICQAELEEKLEAWMAYYDSEMERRENKILQLRYSRDQAEEKKENLHKLYEERTEEMRAWVTFRDLRRYRSAATLIIQSWWRGIMVRKKLGPYKPKKGGGAGGKKKKK